MARLRKTILLALLTLFALAAPATTLFASSSTETIMIAGDGSNPGGG